ncbi:MAG: synthase [Phenylobacterium sp.]|uniref:type 1 glutamine amidotransferase n=1 Tax=Phenylobacterium sp. TaxID=1871053 RepID=UPI00262298D7|nr:type 1 glutamine amidotransferase [Phenylobacterium sp.]MDB5497831.1 synthase [Phenylobacterium sp.]
MKLGILKTGRPPKPCIPEFGTYPDMFIRLLGRDAYDYRVFAVDEGELPESPKACDAYLITGASAGVYDPLPWIAQAEDFLRAAKGQAALVGVCFGHQLMAQAFGGKVIKSPKGWGLGEQDYEVRLREPWMDGAASIRLPGSHQDQVVELPPGAEIWAANDFTPMGALAWRDQPAISLQLHPEFEPAYAVSLIEHRREGPYTKDEADRAVASYQGPDDRARVGGWIRNFLSQAT